MALQLSDIPDRDVAPPGASKSPMRRAMIHNAFGRRGFLKALGVGAVAMSLNALSLLPKLTSRASAAPTTWTSCGQYMTTARRHWAECNPYASGHTDGSMPISHSFCGPDDYYRKDSYVVGSGSERRRVRHYQRATSCANKNTWVWRISNNPTVLPNYRDRRCSDGYYVVRRVSDNKFISQTNAVCELILPRTSPSYPLTPDST